MQHSVYHKHTVFVIVPQKKKSIYTNLSIISGSHYRIYRDENKTYKMLFLFKKDFLNCNYYVFNFMYVGALPAYVCAAHVWLDGWAEEGVGTILFLTLFFKMRITDSCLHIEALERTHQHSLKKRKGRGSSSLTLPPRGIYLSSLERAFSEYITGWINDVNKKKNKTRKRGSLLVQGLCVKLTC